MKNIKQLKIPIILFSIFFVNNFNATIEEFLENPYLIQAPKKIENITKRVAKIMNFNDTYEVTVPKKAGIKINPWNKFVTQGINPQTQNHLLIINPEWFLNIPNEQQDFLLGRYFVIFKLGFIPLSIKILPFFFSFFSIFFIIFLFWSLGKTKIKNYSKWIRFFIAFGISTACNFIFIHKIQIKTLKYFAHKHDLKINRMTLEKTLNKDAAIKALKQLDSSIKKEFKIGETFWKPYTSLFQNHADELKRSNG
ncbi:hypothetical protein KAH94_05655 [bacterium]|nr:hypothetical protein [bacterium]